MEAELEKKRVGMKGSKREKGITLAIIRYSNHRYFSNNGRSS